MYAHVSMYIIVQHGQLKQLNGGPYLRVLHPDIQLLLGRRCTVGRT